MSFSVCSLVSLLTGGLDALESVLTRNNVFICGLSYATIAIIALISKKTKNYGRSEKLFFSDFHILLILYHLIYRVAMLSPLLRRGNVIVKRFPI
jgi:hypothetical protein